MKFGNLSRRPKKKNFDIFCYAIDVNFVKLKNFPVFGHHKSCSGSGFSNFRSKSQVDISQVGQLLEKCQLLQYFACVDFQVHPNKWHKKTL